MLRATVSTPAVKHIAVLAAAALVAFSFVPFPRPAATGPVATALQSASHADRARVAAIYSALADVIARDSGQLITTTSAWRAIYSDALRLAVGGTDFVGKYPDLDKAVEKVLAQHYPQDDLPIDAAMTDKIAAGMRAVEAQCE
jgi:hypothetical protein